MKRDMDLVRKILLEIEKQPYTHQKINLEIEGYTHEQISYHVLLLAEAGLLEAEVSSRSSAEHKPKRLTWEGHEFLAASSNETIWDKAKKVMIEQSGGITFVILKEVLLQMVKKSVGL